MLSRIVVFIVSVLTAATAPAAVLTLEEAVSLALRNNLGLQAQVLEPLIAEADIEAAEAEFDFVLDGRFSWGVTERERTGSALEGTTNDTRRYTLGASKRFSTGTIASVDTTFSRSDSDAGVNIGSNLDYDTSVGATIIQPLAQGAWRGVNLANLRTAQSALSEAQLRLRADALDVVAETEDRYWLLSYAVARQEALQSALDVAEQLVNETTERERVGRATRVEVLEATSALAQRREEILLAQQQVEELADALLAFAGVLEDTIERGESLPEVAAMPREHAPAPEFAQVWPVIVQEDLDSAAQEEVIEQLRQQRIVAMDSARPRVDAVVSAGLLGTDPNRAYNAFEEATERQGHYWTAALEFDWPWRNRLAESRLRQTRMRQEQANIQLVELKQNLLQRTRLAIRDVQIGLRRLEATESAIELAQATFDQSRARFDRGLTTFREVQEAQRDLDVARLSQLEAHLTVVRAQVALDRLQGNLFDKHNLTFSPRSSPLSAP